MNIFDFFRKRRANKQPQLDDYPLPDNQYQPDNHLPLETSTSFKIEFNDQPSIHTQVKEQTGIDLGEEYVRLSTCSDENVCPMCAQFEGKSFLSTDAPKLPLCPDCRCAYEHYFKEDLPPDAVINSKEDFVLPAKCTSIFS